MRVLTGLCDWVARLALLVMVGLVLVEVTCRTLLGVSLQLSDEIGGYLLVLIAFLSLSVTQREGAYHRVTFVQDRLGPRTRAALNLVLEALCLAFVLVVAWQLWRLEAGSWVREDQSDTLLAMPLWIPRAAMVLGMAALAVVLVRDLVRAGRLCMTSPS